MGFCVGAGHGLVQKYSLTIVPGVDGVLCRGRSWPRSRILANYCTWSRWGSVCECLSWPHSRIVVSPSGLTPFPPLPTQPEKNTDSQTVKGKKYCKSIVNNLYILLYLKGVFSDKIVYIYIELKLPIMYRFFRPIRIDQEGVHTKKLIGEEKINIQPAL